MATRATAKMGMQMQVLLGKLDHQSEHLHLITKQLEERDGLMQKQILKMTKDSMSALHGDLESAKSGQLAAVEDSLTALKGLHADSQKVWKQ